MTAATFTKIECGSYDSDDFPKPVLSSDLGGESCGRCGAELW